MRLLTLNIWEGKLPHPLALLFKAEQPDIACLQEVRSPDPLHDWLTPTLTRLGTEIAGLPHTSFAPIMEAGFFRRRMRFGNAVLTRQRPLHEDTIFVHGQFEPDFDFGVADVPRNFQHVELPGGLHVLNYHGHRIRDGHKNGDPVSEQGCIELASYATGLPGKVIIAGDFNLWPDAPALKYLRAHFCDVVADAGVGNTRTWLKGRSEVSDYIFTSPDVNVTGFHVSEHVASDHAALVMDFT